MRKFTATFEVGFGTTSSNKIEGSTKESSSSAKAIGVIASILLGVGIIGVIVFRSTFGS